MAYFDCIVGGSGKGNTLVVTCADDLAGATITCTNGTKTYTKTCPSTSPYEVTFYGLEAGTWTVSATVSGNTYTTTVVITDYEAELGGFNWKTWVDLSKNYTSSDFTDLDDLLDTELAVRELMSIHACVDYLAGIATESADVETIIGNDLCAKWINNRDYALDTLYANTIIKSYMDTADKYFYGEWALVGQVPKMTSNTAPYGEVIYNYIYGTGYEAYRAFDGDTTTRWNGVNTASNNYIGYHFLTPVRITSVYIDVFYNVYPSLGFYKIQGSNDNFVNDIHDLFSGDTTSAVNNNGHCIIKEDFENDTAYEYYRIYSLGNPISGESDVLSFWTLQFYAYAPKGNVPIMTSNTAPYGEAIGTQNSGNENYKAFNGNDSLYTASASSTGWTGYKFTSPVCVKRVSFIPYSGRIKTYTIDASNDGNTWTPLTDTLTCPNSGDKQVVNINNNNYYLMYRLNCTSTYGSNYVLYTLQFYGRELSVSVPKMDTNTTPYGEASASSVFSSNYAAWKAFDGTNSDNVDCWHSAQEANSWIKYEFTTPMVIKGLYLRDRYSGVVPSISAVLQGSNDGVIFSPTLLSVSYTPSDNAQHYFEVDNETPYKIYKLTFTNPSSNQYASMGQIQFYGLDYSEKEFEEGTTKKWLYDHGVELETLTEYGTGTVTKENDDIIFDATAIVKHSGVYKTIDITSYNMLFGILESIFDYYKSGDPSAIGIRCISSDGGTVIASLTKANLNPPTKLGLDVSSINQSCRVASFAYSQKAYLKELWLE